MQQLKFLFRNTRQEFHKSPLQWVAAGCVVVTAVIHGVLSLVDYNFSSSNPIIKLMQWQAKANLSLISMSIIFLVWSLFILVWKKQNNKRLDNYREKILIFVSKNPQLETDQITSSFQESDQLVLFNLQELEKAKFIKANYVSGSNLMGTEPGVYTWHTLNLGLAYLSRNGLINE